MKLHPALAALLLATPSLAQSTITEVNFPGADETRVLDMAYPGVAVGSFTVAGSPPRPFVRWSDGQFQELGAGDTGTGAVASCIRYNGAPQFYLIGGHTTGPGPNDSAAVLWYPPAQPALTYVMDYRAQPYHRAGIAITVTDGGTTSYGLYGPAGPSFVTHGLQVDHDLMTPGSFAATAFNYNSIIGNVTSYPGFPPGSTVAAHILPTGLELLGPAGHESRAWSAEGLYIGGTIDDQAVLWTNDQTLMIPETVGTTGAVKVNFAGYAVGQGSDFFYHRGMTYRLLDLAPPNSGWTRLTPTALPDLQTIGGYGIHDGQARGFIMRTCFVDAENSPHDWSICTHFHISFYAAADGPGPFTYRWRKDGQPISDEPNHTSGSTTAALNILRALTSDAGLYDCLVTNTCYTEAAGSWSLTVEPGPCCYCPSDFNNDGDIGTDADIEAFFACLAGSCCETCCTADVNSDGDTGTDSDIELFFRLLASEPCY